MQIFSFCVQFLDGDPHVLNHYSHEELRNQEDYDRVLEDINATLRKNRAPSKEDRRIHREPSKCTLDSRKSESRDTIKRSSSRTTMDQVPVISSLSKSPSRQHLDPRYSNLSLLSMFLQRQQRYELQLLRQRFISCDTDAKCDSGFLCKFIFYKI